MEGIDLISMQLVHMQLQALDLKYRGHSMAFYPAQSVPYEYV